MIDVTRTNLVTNESLASGCCLPLSNSTALATLTPTAVFVDVFCCGRCKGELLPLLLLLLLPPFGSQINAQGFAV
jgi:hypothetical protein